ncbi:MAG: peptidase and chymotrypsin/Hap [Myxococcales bacterium]|nr:peptidase and chymotrypsin/Hap [Myxococcales bacterium]
MLSFRVSQLATAVLSCLTAAACQRASVDSTGSAIRNGSPTTDHPAVVAVAVARSACGARFIPACTGVLVAPRVVLTAAHCVLGADVNRYEVYFGSDASGGGAILRGSARRHPAYDPATHDFDFGAVLLDEPATAAPLPIATRLPDVGATLTLVGFGVVEVTGAPDGLKRAGTATLSAIEPYDLRMTPSPSITCSGDSGGPVLATDPAGVEVVVGISSWGDSACVSFGVAGRTDAAGAFLAPILDEAATPPPVRVPLTEGTNLCGAACTTADDCPAGTVCQLSSDGQFCQLPGFGRGIVGATCSDGDGCAYCVRVASADSDACRCVRLCPSSPTPMHGGCSGAGPTPSSSPIQFLILALSVGLTRRKGK